MINLTIGCMQLRVLFIRNISIFTANGNSRERKGKEYFMGVQSFISMKRESFDESFHVKRKRAYGVSQTQAMRIIREKVKNLSVKNARMHKNRDTPVEKNAKLRSS
jgi:hypothetical protein